RPPARKRRQRYRPDPECKCECAMSDDDHPRLLLGVTPLAERQIEEQLFGAEQSVAVVGSAADARELLALAERRHADAVLLAAELPALDAGGCARLRSHGLRLLGLALDDQNVQTLEAFGVDQILRPPLTAGDIADACVDTPFAAAEPEAQPARREPKRRSRTGSVLAVVPASG